MIRVRIDRHGSNGYTHSYDFVVINLDTREVYVGQGVISQLSSVDGKTHPMWSAPVGSVFETRLCGPGDDLYKSLTWPIVKMYVETVFDLSTGVSATIPWAGPNSGATVITNSAQDDRHYVSITPIEDKYYAPELRSDPGLSGRLHLCPQCGPNRGTELYESESNCYRCGWRRG